MMKAQDGEGQNAEHCYAVISVFYPNSGILLIIMKSFTVEVYSLKVNVAPDHTNQGPVVRKSVSSNPELKVKLFFYFSPIKAYIRAYVLWVFS